MSVHNDAKRQSPLYKLSEEEIADPEMVIEELFDFADLQQVRGMLWNWLKATVTGGYPEDLDKEERNEIILLYEKIEKLVEAAHVLKEIKAPGKKKRA